MTVGDLLTKISQTLQDAVFARWTKPELIGYMNDGLENIATELMMHKEKEVITVTVGTNTYSLTKTPIDIFNIVSTIEFTMPTPTTIYIVDPIATTIEIEYFCVPEVYTVDADVITLRPDNVKALRNFVLARCYEKEDSPKHFAKAAYFNNEYEKSIDNNSTASHSFVGETTLYRGDFLN